MSNSKAEEDYLKAIYKLSKLDPNNVSTNSIVEILDVKPPTVSNMLQKLKEKNFAQYTRYKGVSLTKSGEEIALKVIRKHRLWETFLVEKFDFNWDEVHVIAEQLEHVDSPELINRLDKFLDFPQFDPHGDPIPDKNGEIKKRYEKTLDNVKTSEHVLMVGVKDHSSDFLKYLERMNLNLGVKIEVVEITSYDKSLLIRTNQNKEITISNQVAKNILINSILK